MRYSTEPKFRKYVKGYGFLSFARRFGDKCGKKLMYTATKLKIEAAKTSSKWVGQKTAKATRDLVGNKIADKITSLSKIKSNEKKPWKTRNLQTARKKTTNYWWFEIVLTPHKNRIPKD